MILIAIILVVLAILGAPLFAVIATSAMTGFHRDEDRSELRIVLDLNDAAAGVTSVETDGTSLQIQVVTPYDGGETPAEPGA